MKLTIPSARLNPPLVSLQMHCLLVMESAPVNGTGEWQYQFRLDLLDGSSQVSLTAYTVDDLMKALLRFWDHRMRWLPCQSPEELSLGSS
jgi:hypothetical protein